MKKHQGLIVALLFAAFAGGAAADCLFCSQRRGFLGGWKCEWVYEDGETGHVQCNDDDGFNCTLSGNACLFVEVIDTGGSGGGTGGGSGGGGGGGGSCLVIGANWCPADCFSCTYQLV